MQLFPARQLLISRSNATELCVEGKIPLVTLVSARDRAVVDPADLRALGYRHVANETYFPGAYYARPLPLWALLKTAYAVREACWCVVWWLHQHGIFHLAAEENEDFRWRDVRPGPG